MGLKARVTSVVDRARSRWAVVDHLVAAFLHYTKVNGNAQAGAATYYGFLSFFPLLALGFFLVGYVSRVYPGAEDNLATALDSVLPGVVGSGRGEIPISTFKSYAGRVGLIGAVTVLYSGLGWLSGIRNALEVMFALPRREQPNFVIGKAWDLLALVVLGVVLVLSVGLSGVVSGLTNQILVWLGFGTDDLLPRLLVWALGHGLAMVATTLLMLAMFRLLAHPDEPLRDLLHGAILGAVGFELLKAVANFLIGQTQGKPAFQAFGVALILVVWINYFSRLVMFAAAWAHTASPDHPAGAPPSGGDAATCGRSGPA